MIEIPARVVYYDNYCVAYLDREFSRFYFSLCPKYLRAKTQRYTTHITIVRLGIETANNNWLYRDQEIISIWYSPIIYSDNTYLFLDAWSDDISEIRIKLGLPQYRFNNCYHITIGNVKDV